MDDEEASPRTTKMSQLMSQSTSVSEDPAAIVHPDEAVSEAVSEASETEVAASETEEAASETESVPEAEAEAVESETTGENEAPKKKATIKESARAVWTKAVDAATGCTAAAGAGAPVEPKETEMTSVGEAKDDTPSTKKKKKMGTQLQESASAAWMKAKSTANGAHKKAMRAAPSLPKFRLMDDKKDVEDNDENNEDPFSCLVDGWNGVVQGVDGPEFYYGCIALFFRVCVLLPSRREPVVLRRK